MNAGERDEILAILTLIHAKSTQRSVPGFSVIRSVGCRTRHYGDWRREFGSPEDLRNAPIERVVQVARALAVERPPVRHKADVHVNDLGVSLKSHSSAPPALVNHTARPGWEFAADQARVSLASLDAAVAMYWRLRTRGEISEDVLNGDPKSPFRAARAELEPMLAYFMFEGTGSGRSKAPAEVVMEFSEPADVSTWALRRPATIVSELWDRLVFSLRSNRGMPRNYPSVSRHYTSRVPSIQRWTVYWQNEYRGALHVRVR